MLTENSTPASNTPSYFLTSSQHIEIYEISTVFGQFLEMIDENQGLELLATDITGFLLPLSNRLNCLFHSLHKFDTES